LVPGTVSADWELADTYTETVGQMFSGVASFNYQLNVTDIPGSLTTYSGTITFNLVTT
jgi:hypothetical protein